MRDDITVCTAFKNTAVSLALARESLLRHEGPFRWHVADGGSTDGADEYARIHAHQYLSVPDGQNWNWAWDNLVKAATTRLVLLVDSDAETLAPVVDEMTAVLDRAGAVCVCGPYPPQGVCQQGGWTLHSQRGWAYHFALFRAEWLQRLLRFWTFGVYLEPIGGRYYDGGHMLFTGAAALEMQTVECEWVASRVFHYGGLSALFNPGEPAEAMAYRQAGYELAGRRLEQLRAGQQTTAGLHWSGIHGWRPK